MRNQGGDSGQPERRPDAYSSTGFYADEIRVVIASEAKQSTLAFSLPHGLLRRFAPRNDKPKHFIFVSLTVFSVKLRGIVLDFVTIYLRLRCINSF
jgi:hypothetical protein